MRKYERKMIWLIWLHTYLCNIRFGPFILLFLSKGEKRLSGCRNVLSVRRVVSRRRCTCLKGFLPGTVHPFDLSLPINKSSREGFVLSAWISQFSTDIKSGISVHFLRSFEILGEELGLFLDNRNFDTLLRNPGKVTFCLETLLRKLGTYELHRSWKIWN